MASCEHENTAWRHFPETNLSLCVRCYVFVTRAHDDALRDQADRLRQAEAEVRRLNELIDDAGKPWIRLDPGIPWEGAIDAAMAAACAEIEKLRANAEADNSHAMSTAADNERLGRENEKLRAEISEYHEDLVERGEMMDSLVGRRDARLRQAEAEIEILKTAADDAWQASKEMHEAEMDALRADVVFVLRRGAWIQWVPTTSTLRIVSARPTSTEPSIIFPLGDVIEGGTDASLLSAVRRARENQ